MKEQDLQHQFVRLQSTVLTASFLFVWVVLLSFHLDWASSSSLITACEEYFESTQN